MGDIIKVQMPCDMTCHVTSCRNAIAVPTQFSLVRSPRRRVLYVYHTGDSELQGGWGYGTVHGAEQLVRARCCRQGHLTVLP